MSLVDKHILDEIRSGNIVIEPFNREQLGPNTYDVRLANVFWIPKTRAAVDPTNTVDNEYTVSKIEYEEVEGPILLMPGQFVLAVTKEKIGCFNGIRALIFGRSSVSRLGLVISEGPFIDTGFEGYITLEIYNQAPYPVWLVEDYRIGHIEFVATSGEPEIPYNKKKNNKYSGIQLECKPHGFLLDKEWKKDDPNQEENK